MLKKILISATLFVAVVFGVFGVQAHTAEARTNQTPWTCTAVDEGDTILVTADANPLYKNIRQAPSMLTVYSANQSPWGAFDSDKDLVYVAHVGDAGATFVRVVAWTKKGWADTFCTVTGR